MEKRNLPLVSILMVTYNSAAFINAAIDSVLASNYDNLELIIRDDVSKDETWNIINSYSDSRIRASRNEKNLGEYANRNVCINQAKGKYLVFIDGDDEIYSNGLEAAVIQMEKFDKNVAFGIARPTSENYERPMLVDKHRAYKMHYFERSIFNLSFSRNMFNTKILQEEGGVPVDYISGDVALRLNLAAKYDTLIIDDKLGKWRKRDGQASDQLSSTLKGILEPYQINLLFLGYENCPLDHDEKIRAIVKIRGKIRLHTLSSLKRGRLRVFKALFTQYMRTVKL